MTFHRDIDASDGVREQPISQLRRPHEDRQGVRPWVLGIGTLACPRCDAPVSLGGRGVSPADALRCPFCGHGGAVRDFLSLASPSRPARVEVRLLPGARRATR